MKIIIFEQKKDDEIKQLKENLEELNQSFSQLELNIKSTASLILQVNIEKNYALMHQNLT